MNRRPYRTALIALAAGGSAGCENQSNCANPNELYAPAASARAMTAEPGELERGRPPVDREQYDSVEDNPFVRVAEEPRSTFSLNVDAASYSNVRRLLRGKRDVPAGAVRVEELVNYFPYDYAAPASEGEDPLTVRSALVTCPWAKDHSLVRLAVKAQEIAQGERPAMNLVFLLDVSGSMNSPDRLPRVKDAMRRLVQQLRPQDSLAVVVYAGASGLAVRPTNDDQKNAGDVGSGHTVTAFYEVVPPGAAMPTTRPGVDDLKYQSGPEPVAAADSGELMTVKLRYKRPDGEASKLLTQAVPAAEPQKFSAADDDFRFAAGVAAFGMILRDSPHKGAADLAWVRQTTKSARGGDAGGYRGEFVDLVDLAAKRAAKRAGGREDGRDEPASARR